jgi:phage terminase large subunit-like protein
MKSNTHRDLIKIAQAELAKAQTKSELPHLYLFKRYPWQVEYLASLNRLQFICAANQCGKSSIQATKAVILATETEAWPLFFRKRKPRTFWYIYPDNNKIQEEVTEKWEREILPKGSMKFDPKFGWSYIMRKGGVGGISFNSGVNLYFKTWKQDLQSSTIDAVFFDEEPPAKLYDEVAQRVNVSDGIMSFAFTATQGQAFFYDIIEKRGQKGERFPHAAKWQVGLRECMYYADGTPTHITQAEIDKRRAKCGTKQEEAKRIEGRFVSDSGLKYPTFTRERNITPVTPLPMNWQYYAGVDIGTGGGEGHPAAIAIVAVKPDGTKGRVVKLWKGDDKTFTDTTYVLNKYLELSKGLPMTNAFYDWASKEFFLRATSAGVPFSQANKDHSFGEDLLNVLFKNQVLDIDDMENVDELVVELLTVKQDSNKRSARDDLIDALRYACSKVPWNMDHILSSPEFYEAPKKESKRLVRGDVRHTEEINEYDFNTEIDDYNNLLEDF